MALLQVEDVSVQFGGLQALSHVTLGVEAGEVTGLIGPNGAGKTTLFNVITGLQVPSGGRVTIDGRDITQARPHQRARLGIGRTFQRLEVFGTLSVRDNVLVAAEMRRGWSRERFRPRQLADEIIERIGLQGVAELRVDALPTGTARLVEVARALATKPRVLLLDEPSSGLNEAETKDLSGLLHELSAERLGVLLVEHDMHFVMGTCERIHVLDFGRMIASGSPAEVQADPVVRAAYLGAAPDEVAPSAAAAVEAVIEGTDERALADVSALSEAVRAAAAAGTVATRARPPDAGGAPALELRGVRAAYGAIDVLHGVDLALRQGEVYALLGPNGAGKSTTLKVAVGQLTPTDGEVLVHGVVVNKRGPDAIARAGVCLVPEGRGIFPNLTVTENLRMATYTGVSLKHVTERAFSQFPRLAERRKQLAGTLSGGEQQMLAMARALSTDPKILLLDELSMGLAPLVVEELYAVVGQIAAQGLSILVVEQFAHEVLGVARIASIMLHGRIQMTGAPSDVAVALDRAYLGGAVDS